MVQFERNTTRSIRGFTLIESMVVIAVLAVVAALATPSLSSFVTKNRVSSISNEFAFAMQQARALAVAKNSCATICASKTVTVTVTSGSTCSNSGTSDDFQKGWVIFINPACDSTQTEPTAAGGTLIAQRQSATEGYTIKPSVAELSMVMFDPRGFANLTATGYFTITSPSSDSTLQRIVCIQASGQSTVRRDTSC